MSQITKAKINTDLYECTEGVLDPQTGLKIQIPAKDLNYVHVLIQEGKPSQILKGATLEDEFGNNHGKADFKGWVNNPDKHAVLSIITLRTWETMQKDRQVTVSGATSGNNVSYSLGQNQYTLVHDPREMSKELKEIADNAVSYKTQEEKTSDDLNDVKSLVTQLAKIQIEQSKNQNEEPLKPKTTRRKSPSKVVEPAKKAEETKSKSEVKPETISK